MKKQTRIGALLLAFTMAFSLLTSSAWATALSPATTQTTATETIVTAAAPNLKPTKLSSVKRVSSTKIKVTWKKASSAKGYQIQYSTSNKFKSAKNTTVKSYKTTSKTISGLKKNKTYYVRVRTYQTSSKKTYYSSWSNVKSAKTTASSSTNSSSTVYCTASGTCYHRKGCPTLKRSKHVYSVSKSKAKSKGLRACKVCKP